MDAENTRSQNIIAKFVKDKWFYIVALLLPWIIGLGHSYIHNTWVTGNGNIATGDLQAQIIPIAYEYWDKVHSGDSFAFTWHLADGVNFSSLPGYLNSPFTKIMLLLPRNMIPDYMQFIMMLKWSLAAFSMVFFFFHTHYNTLKKNKREVSLFLGLGYALGTGIMSFITYVQFMDAIVCFPFLLILLERMVEKKSWKLYFIVLLCIIQLNSYIGYQICLFLALWYLMLLIDTDKGEVVKKFFLFAGVSVLAAMTTIGGIIAGINLASGRLDTAAAEDKSYYLDKALISVHDFLSQMFMCNQLSSAHSYLPNIYFSVTAAFLVLLFPMIKMRRRTKIYIMLVAAFLAASFFSGHLSLIWHIFQIPNGLYHRFMYLFIFFMLFIALLVLTHLEDLNKRAVTAASVAALILYAYVFFSTESYGDLIIYFGTVMVIVFMIILFILLMRKSIEVNNALCVFAICGIIELCISSFQAFSFFEQELFYGDNGYVEQACELLNKAELEVGERVTTASPTPDIGLITGQSTDSVFMSYINTDNKRLHEQLGMATNTNVEFETRGASPIVNLIYNIRYGHGESRMLFSDDELVDEDDFYGLYRMKRLAGLGYMVSDSIRNWEPLDNACFDVQNDYVRLAVGGENVFEQVIPKMTCTDYFGTTYDPDESMLAKGTYEYNMDPLYRNEFDTKQFDFTADDDMDLYMLYKCPADFLVYIFIDGEQVHRDYRSFDQSTYHIGQLKKGQKVTICTAPTSRTANYDNYHISFSFGDFHEEAYEKAYEKLSKNVYRIDEMTSTYISGTVHADEAGIMMTSVPAESQFHVKVDGDEEEYDIIGGALIGVPLESGDHVVEFSYGGGGSGGLFAKLGYWIGKASLIIYVILCVCSGVVWFRNRKRVVKETNEE